MSDLTSTCSRNNLKKTLNNNHNFGTIILGKIGKIVKTLKKDKKHDKNLDS